MYSVDNETLHVLNTYDFYFESKTVPGTSFFLHRVDTKFVPGTNLDSPYLHCSNIGGASEKIM